MDNKYKAIELSDEQMAQVSGGARGGVVSDSGGVVSDGKCGQTVNLSSDGKCESLPTFQCNGCQYKAGFSQTLLK